MKKRLLGALSAFLLLLSLAGASVKAGQVPVADSGRAQQAQEMTVHFIDVGQGDSTLITCGGDAMLIDAGDNNQGTKIQNYLRKQGVRSLKYVIGTHPHADHIGGLDVILYKFDCETVIMTNEQKDTNTYRDVVDTMKTKGYKNTLPVVGQQYSLGDASFTIVGPSSVGSNSNDNSVAILLTHGSNKFLFTGDAQEEEEADILNSGISIDADVYKAAHHGSRTSSSKQLLEAVSPKYAVISCQEGNSYGHPNAETLNNLRAMGVQVYRTDEQGTITASSDGRKISWNCSPSTSWIAGEPTGSGQKASASGARTAEAASGTGTTEKGAVASGAAQTAQAAAASGTGTAAASGVGTAEKGAAQTAQAAAAPETGTAAQAASPAEKAQAAVEAAAQPAPEAQSEVPAAASYICNKNTGKFHYPSCASVGQMSEKNKLAVTGSREDVIAQGYEPCKRCNP